MRGIDAETISGLSPMTALQLLSKCARAVGVKDCAIQVAKRWPFLVRTRLFNGREMYVDLRSAIGRGVFATGKFDMATISPALETLCTGGVFVDVGANIGFYSILAIDHVGPAGQAICFEIDTRPLRALRRTVKYLELGNLRIEEKAVSDKDGLLNFIRRESMATIVLMIGVKVGKYAQLGLILGSDVIPCLELMSSRSMLRGRNLPSLTGLAR